MKDTELKDKPYAYTHVPHVQYPPLDSPYEVSPQPESSSSAAPTTYPNDTKSESQPVDQRSYAQHVVPRSYEPAPSQQLPGYYNALADRVTTQQPAATSHPRTDSNTMVLVDSPAVPKPVPSIWRTGLFECLQSPLRCLDGLFCSPCIVGRTYSRLESEGQDSTSFNVACMTCGACTLFTGGIGGCLYVFTKRSMVRQRYEIQGEDLDDICASCVCTCCAVAQMDMEVERRLHDNDR